MSRFWKLTFAIVLCESVGILSGSFTAASIPTWYAGLSKPAFSPPNWVFGPVWTLLYASMGAAAFLIWESKNKKYKIALAIFALQLALNFAWTLLFFGLRNPVLALGEILLLWFSILITVGAFYRIRQSAAYILFPYLLWVSFATLLNFAIVYLN